MNILDDKMPSGAGLVNDFLRGSPDCPGCREAGRRAGTSMELSQICFTKPTLQGILSVSTGGITGLTPGCVISFNKSSTGRWAIGQLLTGYRSQTSMSDLVPPALLEVHTGEVKKSHLVATDQPN